MNFDIKTPEGQKLRKEIIYKYLEGLQWIFYYYYKGVQHWAWFYPYHYAPLISDLVDLSSRIEFAPKFVLKNENILLTPFQQLLCIMPRSSTKLLPKSYAQLLSSDSPISDLYPTTYSLDFNGRAMPWEAIKLIPFIDILRVKEAEKKLLQDPKNALTPRELERNQYHEPVEYLFSSHPPEMRVASPLPSMPDLINPTCTTKIYRYGVKPELTQFEPKVHIACACPCFDFPSLKYLPIIDCTIESIHEKDKDFQQIVLNLKDSEISEEKIKELIGKNVFVKYPFQREATITMIFTITKHYYVYFFY